MSVFGALAEWLALGSTWELLAVGLALLYLVLAVKRSLWCWPCAFISSAIYVWIMFDKRLYMQTALNVFYIAMAVYGYFEWRRHRDEGGQVIAERWPLQRHAYVVLSVLALSLVNGWLLTRTDGALPYADSFITWGSVVTTWMVARRVLENWLYWIVVDSVAAAVYFHQGLAPTGLLFILYVGIVIRGYFVWRRAPRIVYAGDGKLKLPP